METQLAAVWQSATLREAALAVPLLIAQILLARSVMLWAGRFSAQMYAYWRAQNSQWIRLGQIYKIPVSGTWSFTGRLESIAFRRAVFKNSSATLAISTTEFMQLPWQLLIQEFDE